jgi:hypothetical protein
MRGGIELCTLSRAIFSLFGLKSVKRAPPQSLGRPFYLEQSCRAFGANVGLKRFVYWSVLEAAA